MRSIVVVLALSFACSDEPTTRDRGSPAAGGTRTPVTVSGGGEACAADRSFCVVIAANGLSANATVLISRATAFPQPEIVLAGTPHDVRLEPASVVLTQPAILRFDVGAAETSGWSIAFVAGGTWDSDGITDLIHGNGLISARTSHFTVFGVVDATDTACGCDADAGCSDACDCDPGCVAAGEPDVELEYNGIVGPRFSDCALGGCVMAEPLDFGTVPAGTNAISSLFVRNTASCLVPNDAEVCATCRLTIEGLGFAPGTNDAGYFSFVGSTATPFDLVQDDPECGFPSFVRPLVQFAAPEAEGAHETVLVVESDDPDEPRIEVRVRAAVGNAPVAIAKFRSETNPDTIQPFDRVYVDGLALGNTSSSHDPRNPSDASLIQGYQWEIMGPPGVDPAQYQANPPGMNAGLMDFVTPLAGHYVVKLTVRNDAGIASPETAQSRLEFDAMSSSRVLIQLVWDDPTNDQDLHFTNDTADGRICNEPWDCHWLNRQPVWFGGSPGEGANPTVDIDDTNGLGPENISIDAPAAGSYRVYVHYYGDQSFEGNTPTQNTVRIYVDGVQRAEYRRTLTLEKQLWAVAEIVWQGNGATITPYPSDAQGEIGAVALMPDCASPGFVFP